MQQNCYKYLNISYEQSLDIISPNICSIEHRSIYEPPDRTYAPQPTQHGLHIQWCVCV